jgi:hypothetical protein
MGSSFNQFVVLAVIAFSALNVMGQTNDATTAQPIGLYTVDYIIIGVTSAAAAASIVLVIVACISSRKEKKVVNKVQPVTEEAVIMRKSTPVNEGYDDELDSSSRDNPTS